LRPTVTISTAAILGILALLCVLFFAPGAKLVRICRCPH
jgi:hypothetical protein